MDEAREPSQAFAIVVTFNLTPGSRPDFLTLVTENARLSLSLEPECLTFDVLVPEAAEDSVMLYEVYASEAAFAQHLRLPHFAQFDTLSRRHVAQKQVSRYMVAP